MLASLAIVGFLLATILFILNVVMAVPLLMLSGIGCYYYYGQVLGLKALYKRLPGWVFLLGLELGGIINRKRPEVGMFCRCFGDIALKHGDL